MTVKEVAAVLLLLASSHLVASDTSTTADLLWPVPQSAQFGSGVYSLSSEAFSITTAGDGGSSVIITGAVDRYWKLIFETPAPFYPSGAGSDASANLSGLVINVETNSETLSETTDESCKRECVLNLIIIV